MYMRLDAHLVAAVVLGSALACGGGGGGGGGFKDPGHQASALDAKKLSGIGDSMMQGMHTACDGQTPDLLDFDDHEVCSFAQGNGEDVFSVYWRYKVVSGLPGGEEFVSESGASMIGDGFSQAKKICDQSPKPNRILILLGANDVCQSDPGGPLPSTDDFSLAVVDMLGLLASDDCELPSGTRVHVLSVPRLDHLAAAVSGKSCSWVTAQACPVLYGIPTADIATRIDEYNTAILDAVSTTSSPNVTFTTDWKGTTPNTSIGTHVYTAAEVSDVDCFHPSSKGQNMLACAAWESWEGLGDADNCQ
jgi:lysophospholipase L1-like esterase